MSFHSFLPFVQVPKALRSLSLNIQSHLCSVPMEWGDRTNLLKFLKDCPLEQLGKPVLLLRLQLVHFSSYIEVFEAAHWTWVGNRDLLSSTTPPACQLFGSGPAGISSRKALRHWLSAILERSRLPLSVRGSFSQGRSLHSLCTGTGISNNISLYKSKASYIQKYYSII